MNRKIICWKKETKTAGVDYLYQKEGMTERVLNLVSNGLAAHGLSIGTHDPEAKRFKVEQWKDFEYFISNIYDDTVEKILEIAKGEANFQFDSKDMPMAFVQTALKLPEHWRGSIYQTGWSQKFLRFA